MHGRGSAGPIIMLTRQPAEGRARDGGLRIGEMEIECLEAYGSLFLLKERLMECSDGFQVNTCEECGALTPLNVPRGVHKCAMCGNISKFTEMHIPYASKLMMQEFSSLAVGMSLHRK